MARINKELKGGAKILPIDEVRTPYGIRRRFGISSLDSAIAGGLPGGTLCQVFGPDGCLDQDTFVQYAVHVDGRKANHKGGTIKRLYERFHNLKPTGDGRGKYARAATEGAYYTAPSVNDEGRVFHNEIVDVVDAGTKECFLVITQTGKQLISTDEHEYFNGKDYVALRDLQAGSTVYIHNNTPHTVPGRVKWKRKRRRVLMVKYHPTAPVKVVHDKKYGDFPYHRLPYAHAVVEASLNGVSTQTYVSDMNRDGAREVTRIALDVGLVVHHKDGDPQNAALENLEVMSKEAHDRHHAHDRHNDLRFVAVPDVIVSIEPVGPRKVYDIKMCSPHRNFVADGFVVHNSGKDYLTNRAMACIQEDYGDDANIYWMSFGYKPDPAFMRMSGVKLAFSDDELLAQGIDPKKATKEQRGVTVGNLIFVDIADQPDALSSPAEYLLTVVQRFIESGDFQLGIINELGSGETRDNTKKGLHEDARMATFATLMSDFCRKMYTGLRRDDSDGNPNATTVIAINPVRANMDPNSAKYQKYVQGSGHALKHAKVVDIHIDHKMFIKEGTEKVGKIVKWKIAKGKLGISEGSEGEFSFYFGKGVDTDRDTCVSAKALGIIFNRGKYTYITGYDDLKIGGGFEGAIAYLMANPDVMENVRQMTVNGVLPDEETDTAEG